jgi:cellobiose phosphorylase
MSDVVSDHAGFSLSSPAGLRADFNANGSLRRFDCGPLLLNLFVGNEIEGGPTNIYLRRGVQDVQWTPLLGPSSPTQFHMHPTRTMLIGVGTWLGVNYSIALRLAQQSTAWFWHVRLENATDAAHQLDLTYAQDLGLAPYGAVRLNEFYVSQYIDHTPLTDSSHGAMVASRQNAAVDGRNPWSLIGSLRAASSFATDARQLHGLASRAGEAPIGLSGDLPGHRLQHEHAMAVLRDSPIRLESGARADAGFFGVYVADHPDATSPSDLRHAASTLSLSEAMPVAIPFVEPSRPAAQSVRSGSLFSTASALNGLELDRPALQKLFAPPWRHEELGEGGRLHSFFYDTDRHVVLQEKERLVLRPHGHLLRSGRHTTPDETALTSTVWMNGVFHSMLTQGHVSINRLLSTVHSYLGLFRSHGQRVFIDVSGTWKLLNLPSAFEISPDECRWIYRLGEDLIEIRAAAHSDPHEMTLAIEVIAGAPRSFLIAHHVALNGDDGSAPGATLQQRAADTITLTAAPGSDLARRFPTGNFQMLPMSGTQFAQIGGDELLFADGQSRRQPFLVLVTLATARAGLRIRGNLLDKSVPAPLHIANVERLIPTLSMRVADSGLSDQVARLADIVPWLAHNALVHYLAPRGLEQYSGGGWGTRDVCQGPMEMLLAMGRWAAIRDLLLRVMRQQNSDGDWPQWFMFFDRERDIRPGDSHGDIVFWPLLALAQYLIASGDGAVLDERVAFFDSGHSGAGEPATIWQHVERALSLIERRVIAGTSLAAYGHGDWNDSLQPADPRLRDHMCSAWTVTLHYQTLKALAEGCRKIGRPGDVARFEEWARHVHADFQRLLIVDGVLTGYAVFEDGGSVRYLLHPSDAATGIRYSALAIVHAILEDMLTPAQIRAHLKVIDQYLSAPDGVRLFDRPMAYYGGIQRLFQRAETATFFGREIGLMYTHAHLRYAQAMAHIGAAERLFKALCQATPIAIRSIVASATARQSNCYYSSSDAAFNDRYQASTEYDRVATGSIALDGGWRVYSSGAGIALGLIVRRFLGLSCEADVLSIDPVIPHALDGLRVKTMLNGRPIEVTYQIGSAGCGVRAIELNGQSVAFNVRANPHRSGAAEIALATFVERTNPERNDLAVVIG